MSVADVGIQLEDGPYFYGGPVRGRVEFDPELWDEGAALVLSLQAWRRVVQPVSGRPSTNHQLFSTDRTFVPAGESGGSFGFEMFLPEKAPDWGHRVPRWLLAVARRLPFLADVGPVEWRLVASRFGTGRKAAVVVQRLHVVDDPARASGRAA